MEIQRYKLFLIVEPGWRAVRTKMEPNPKGEWVHYDEAEEASQKEIATLRKRMATYDEALAQHRDALEKSTIRERELQQTLSEMMEKVQAAHGVITNLMALGKMGGSR